MVVGEKLRAKQEFSKRLNDELDGKGAPRRGRPIWLRQQLNNIVSYEACRKWLTGLDIPDQANLSVLCEKFRLNPNYLTAGLGLAPGDPVDGHMERLQRLWTQLSDEAKDHVLKTAEFAHRPHEPKKQRRPDNPMKEFTTIEGPEITQKNKAKKQ